MFQLGNICQRQIDGIIISLLQFSLANSIGNYITPF